MTTGITVKERPIIFNGEMVRAVLDGRKTQTRRVIKPQPTLIDGPHRQESNKDEWAWCSGEDDCFEIRRCPYGNPGDRLWGAMEIPSLGRKYCADTAGQIWSRARDGMTWVRLKGTPQSKGYLTITPAVGGKYRTRLIHRLVAEAFYGYEPGGMRQARHLNGNPADNRVDNLDWGNQRDNWADRLLHGGGCGEAHHAAKLSNKDADEIRYSIEPQRHLASRYGVTQSVIWGIRNGYLWSEAPPARGPNCPRWASRLLLEITDVRVERVQEISVNNARAEGSPWDEHGFRSEHRPWFIDTWDSMNAKRGYGWDVNPWVWVIEFRRKEAE